MKNWEKKKQKVWSWIKLLTDQHSILEPPFGLVKDKAESGTRCRHRKLEPKGQVLPRLPFPVLILVMKAKQELRTKNFLNCEYFENLYGYCSNSNFHAKKMFFMRKLKLYCQIQRHCLYHAISAFRSETIL